MKNLEKNFYKTTPAQLPINFILLKQKNRGAGISRNKGIKISKGKFISFLDSDDMYYDDSALEFLVFAYNFIY